jgi:hypothetical protein
MVIRFFDGNPIFYHKHVGSWKSEVGCPGYFSFLARIILDYHFTGIIAYIHVNYLLYLSEISTCNPMEKNRLFTPACKSAFDPKE